MTTRPFRVVLITDPAFDDAHVIRCVRSVGGALPPGSWCVQLRDKRRPLVSLRLFAGQLRSVTREVGAGFVVNGRPRLARDVGADGVHLGADGGTVEEARSVIGPRAWLSVAAHDDGDVRRAVIDGADAVLVSAIYPTSSGSLPGELRRDGAPSAKPARGLEAIRSARALAGPLGGVIALGGVTPGRALACAAAGASGVAVIRALLASRDPAGDARATHDAFTGRATRS